MADGALTRNGTPKLDCIVTVVDALRMRDEFGCGEDLTAHHHDDEDIENLIIQQIEFCNIVILNKVSEITPEELKRVRTIVLALNPGVRIIECDYADIDLSSILDTHMFDFNKVATSAAWVSQLKSRLKRLQKKNMNVSTVTIFITNAITNTSTAKMSTSTMNIMIMTTMITALNAPAAVTTTITTAKERLRNTALRLSSISDVRVSI